MEHGGWTRHMSQIPAREGEVPMTRRKFQPLLPSSHTSHSLPPKFAPWTRPRTQSKRDLKKRADTWAQLAYSRVAGTAPDATCRFSREGRGAGSRWDFIVGCPNALAASDACFVTDRWFTPNFYVIARFCIDAWMADVACPIVCQLVWPACWLDTPDRSSSSSSHVVQDVWDVYRDELGVVPQEVVGSRYYPSRSTFH